MLRLHVGSGWVIIKRQNRKRSKQENGKENV